MRFRVALVVGLVMYYGTIGAVVNMFLPGLDRVARILSFGGDLMMLGLALTALSRIPKFYGRTLAFLFAGASLFTLLYNLERVDLLTHLNGLREPLFLFSALVVCFDLFHSEYREALERWMTGVLIIFALMQIPFALVQFQAYGAGDEVGGSLGPGGSGVLTQLLFVVGFYLIVRNGSLREGSGFSLPRIGLYSLLLIPVGLNETKISFVYLGVFFLMLLETRKLYRTIPVVIIGAVLLVLLGEYYSENVQDPTKLLSGEFLERYLFYDRRESVDIPRFQKLILMFQLMANDLWTYVIGFGYGLFQGGNILGTSNFSRALYYFSGSRSLLNSVWMQGGIIAVGCYGLVMFRYLGSVGNASRNVKRFAWFLAFILLTMWLYNNAIFNKAFAGVVAYMIIWIQSGGIDRNDDVSDGASEEADSAVSLTPAGGH